MSAKKVFFVMIGVLVLLIGLGIASIVFGSNLLKSKANSLMNAKLDNKVLDEQQTALIQANKDIIKYADMENIAKTIVPQDKDQAKTVREIVKLAADSNIKLATISFPSSNLGTAQAKPTTPASGDTSKDTPKVETPPITQVKPVDGIKNVYQLEINIQSDTNTPIPYDNFISFLEKIEQNRRTAQVTNINVQPSQKERNKLTFSVTINVFLKP